MARKILRVTGADRAGFLQNLVTNDVGRLSQGLVYAALLTPQGKYLADFFLVPGGAEAILVDVDAGLAPGLAQRLGMYRLRADVAIEEAPLHVHLGLGEAPADAFPDPRHPALGWRAYRETPQADPPDLTALRVAHCVPESGIELVPNESYILEAGLERLGGVDFAKGCYVGQEVTARMKHKTELRKGLRTVAVEGAAPVGTEIRNAEDRPAGTLFSQAEGRGIAWLRFDRVTDPMQAGEAVVRPLP